MYAAVVYALYHIVLSVPKWLKLKSGAAYAAMNAAEETLYPPLMALGGIMLLSGIVQIYEGML